MTDVLLEVIRTIILLILLVFLWREGKRRAELSREGWRLILGAFCLLLFGSVLDVTDNFQSLNRFKVIGDTPLQALLEKIVGYLGGFLLLTVGLLRWLPTVTGVAEKEATLRDLAKANEALDNLNRDLEQRVDERTDLLQTELRDRKRAEEARQESERRFRAIFNQTFQFIGLMTPDGTLIEANMPALDFDGLKESEVLGLPFWETPWWTHSSEQQDRLRDAVARAAAGEFVRFEAWHPAPDGSIHHVDCSIKPVKDELGQVYLLIPEGRDITDRKLVEELLLKEKALSDEYINSLPGLFYVFDEQRFVRWNTEWERVTGYSAEELGARYGTDFFEGKDQVLIEERMGKVFREGASEAEAELVTKDGRKIPYYFTGLRKAFDGKDHLVGLGIDVTDRKRAEDALRESEEQLRAIADYTYDWESWFAPDGRLMWVNPAVETFTGYSVGECGKMADYPLPIVHEEDRTEFRECLQRAVAEKASANDIEFRISRKSGQVEWMAFCWQPIFNAQGKHIGQRASGRDVTDRKRAEEALRTSEQKYKVLFEESTDATLIIDKNRFLDCNEAAVEMLRYSSKQGLLRTHPSELSPKTQPDGRPSHEKADEMMAMAYEQGSHRFEWDHMRADGEVFPVEVLLTAIPVEEKKILHVVWRDITERKEAEGVREQLIAKLEAQNAELERFTYTVSHDLKSPLITIKGYVGLLQQGLAEGDSESAVNDLVCISNAADKMSQLLSDLLELSRIGRLINQSEEVSLEELAREALEIVGGQVKESGVHVEISVDLPVVFGDRLRLLEVMQNLIDNAVKYMGDQPQPRVEIGSRRDGNETVCYVRDNGIGIEPRYHEKVFGLFDQLNPKVDGSGIGLSLVNRIIEVHGGRVWVESEGSGHGSTFCFTIPASSESQ